MPYGKEDNCSDKQMKKVAELVFIPTPAFGHFVPNIEFANRLLDRDDRFSITVLVMRTPASPGDIPAYIETLAATHTRIRFISLPHVDITSAEFSRSPEKFFSDGIDCHKPYVKHAIINHVLSNSKLVPLAGLVIDFFSTSMIDVAKELGVPSYLFFTCSAAFLGLTLYLPARHDEVGKEFEESDTDSVIPGYVNPVLNSVLPQVLFNKFGGYTTYLNLARRFKESKGIIVNSYAELESHAVTSLLHDRDATVPPVYTVGPLIDVKGQTQVQTDATKRDEIIKWLDDQPPSSVIFLCFGSVGSFGEDQVKEIAVGLEQSGQRFLWSLRKPPPKDKLEGPSDYTTDLQEILPNRFLERTKNIGMVCGWAPQNEILAHRSIGGFVSHCGWNSILESLWHGVPIVTWPMYAEQQINAFQMVRELGLAVELRLDYKSASGEVVSADEITRAIRCVMDKDNKVSKRVKDESQKSRTSVLMDDGSSFAAYGHLIEDILRDLL